MITGEYLRFPPHSQHVLVPVEPRAAAALGLTLYTASRPRALLMQHATWAAVRVGGLRLAPGRREAWNPPFAPDVLAELLDQWARSAGRAVEGLAVYNRPQSHRPAVALLVCAGRRSMLVRLRTDPDELGLERRVAEHALRGRGAAFGVPRVRAHGSAGGWSWVGYEVMGTRPHSPVTAAGRDVFAQVSDLVEAVIPRPAGVPPTWRGAHGDLTPWNFRRVGGHRWIIDWEDACYAPDGADQTYFAASAAAMTRTPSRRALAAIAPYEQARQYWTAELTTRSVAGRDEHLVERMLSFLN